ncbi:hypothetical protein ACFO9Q_18580 [Paenibacillus sp. GCM10023252]|uniref:hypothetical protein n=1 Tax=Paenibacillus sp. GCM10023252 TaxID=3252649 RepID=UPI003606A3C2
MNDQRHSFSEWVKSGSENIPPDIREGIHGRFEFHSTKAIVCGVLLLLFVMLSKRIWTALIKKSRVAPIKWTFKERAYLVCGVATVALSLLMMIIVAANMQGAIAPLSTYLLGLMQ